MIITRFDELASCHGDDPRTLEPGISDAGTLTSELDGIPPLPCHIGPVRTLPGVISQWELFCNWIGFRGLSRLLQTDLRGLKGVVAGDSAGLVTALGPERNAGSFCSSWDGRICGGGFAFRVSCAK